MELAHYETLYRYELHHWWYRVRRELIHDMLSDHFGDRTDLRLADIGCGTGALTKELERYGECIGVDFSEQAVSFCRSRGVRNVQQGTAEDTGFEANTFDVVLCLDVLEHLQDDTKGVAEIHRILKPDGIAIVFVPAFMFLWGITDELSHHRHRYRLRELAEKFKPENFTILRKSYFNTLLFLPISLIRVTVRVLGIRTASETTTESGILNTLLYRIFTIERRLLRHTDLPFGVSAMLVVQKK